MFLLSLKESPTYVVGTTGKGRKSNDKPILFLFTFFVCAKTNRKTNVNGNMFCHILHANASQYDDGAVAKSAKKKNE